MPLFLPATTAALHASVPAGDRHPGLQLDKYTAPGSQEAQKDALAAVTATAGAGPLLASLWARRQPLLAGAQTFTASTSGPLTLHLARAAALENAGICLHPLYGFVYLPGSGLKGMARAYAEQVDRAPPEEVRRVFGNEPGEPDPDRQAAGAVVFHDAWPVTWPRLIVDIVNNHHRDYYGGAPDAPPGDWEEPNMVSFLAVPVGQAFAFAVAPRLSGPDQQTLAELARRWLLGALCHEGAGAKTAAGYGGFRPVDAAIPALPTANRAEFAATLELVTPAFLAGAHQRQDDCDLRPATLRGLLRWWWRTLHADAVDLDTLRVMEAAVWGDTASGGPVRLTVGSVGSPPRQHVPGKGIGRNRGNREVLVTDADFLQEHSIAAARTTQPLFYAAYGTDEMRTGEPASRKWRWVVMPGARWQVRLTARPWTWTEAAAPGRQPRHMHVTANDILDQAKAAMWLFSHFGGAGAKARKGFGSFADPRELGDWDLARCQAVAEAFRHLWQHGGIPFQKGRVDSLALARIVGILEQQTTWRNAWYGLDQIGMAMQDFAQNGDGRGFGGKHNPAKAALGLPRKVHGPLGNPLPHQRTHQRPTPLRGPNGDRFAAPIFYHLAPGAQGRLLVRALVFKPDHLWSTTPGEVTTHIDTLQTLEALFGFLQARWAPAPPPPPPPPRPLNQGQTVAGLLRKAGVGYTALFPRHGRQGVVMAWARGLPAGTPDDAPAEFFVQRATRADLHVKFLRLLPPEPNSGGAL